ncbi:MAG: hypothetical protein ACT4UP_07660 [Gammaproteobacteria bacterium]
MNIHYSIPVVLASALAYGFLALMPQSSSGQAAALPKSPGGALRSGWQIEHFSVGYAPLARVEGSDVLGTSTSFGTDEVHYYVLRKEGAYILCYSQLVMLPGAARYQPWKHECMPIG